MAGLGGGLPTDTRAVKCEFGDATKGLELIVREVRWIIWIEAQEVRLTWYWVCGISSAGWQSHCSNWAARPIRCQ